MRVWGARGGGPCVCVSHLPPVSSSLSFPSGNGDGAALRCYFLSKLNLNFIFLCHFRLHNHQSSLIISSPRPPPPPPPALWWSPPLTLLKAPLLFSPFIPPQAIAAASFFNVSRLPSLLSFFARLSLLSFEGRRRFLSPFNTYHSINFT